MYSFEHIQGLVDFAKCHKFSFPKGFDENSTDDLAKKYNGIGAEWLPSNARKILTYFLRHLEPASLVHDVEYLSEDKSYLSFTRANMRLIYNAAKSGYFFSGLSCGLICQVFGWSAWKEGKETMAWDHYLKETEDE